MKAKAELDLLVLSTSGWRAVARLASCDGVRGNEVRDSKPLGMGWNGSGEYPASIDPPAEPRGEPGVEERVWVYMLELATVEPLCKVRGDDTSGRATEGERGRVIAEDGVGRVGVGEWVKTQLGIVDGVAVYSVMDVLGVSYCEAAPDLGVSEPDRADLTEGEYEKAEAGVGGRAEKSERQTT